MAGSTVPGVSALATPVFDGFGAMVLVGPDAIRAVDRGGNMAAPLLAETLGGTPFLGFIAAVAFAIGCIETVAGVAVGDATHSRGGVVVGGGNDLLRDRRPMTGEPRRGGDRAPFAQKPVARTHRRR